jgi:glycosyltransferase involved in cell wall biosynthesis
MQPALQPLIVCVLAHNEERRIDACLQSIVADGGGEVPVHVLVNGSTDGTARIVRNFAREHSNVSVHVYAEGGKARTWNRFLFQDLADFGAVHVFVDGDAEVAPGSLGALAQTLERNPRANAASALPLNGRKVAAYRNYLQLEHGVFGDLYALRGSFLARMRAAGLRLPADLVGDDALIGALAKTDLGPDSEWDEDRVLPCPEAGFLCEPASLLRPHTLAGQYRRMINYSVRHFQNRMVSHIMRSSGPAGLPPRLADHYPDWLPRWAPRRDPLHWWFDRAALARMAQAKRRAPLRPAPCA